MDFLYSLNAFHNLETISADSPEKLVMLIKSIKTPIHILNIVFGNGMFHAFVMGDIKVKKLRKDINHGNSNSKSS